MDEWMGEKKDGLLCIGAMDAGWTDEQTDK